MERLSLEIDGMSCGHCVASVKHALSALPGVQVDAVSIGAASLSYDASVETADTIVKAVSKAGYTARVGGAASATSR
jgi:copper chaperone